MSDRLNSLFEKYFSKVHAIFRKKENQIFEMDGSMLLESGDLFFKFQQALCRELKDFALKENIEINKIVFVICGDMDTLPKNSYYRISSESISRFAIFKEKDIVTVKFFKSDSIEVEEKI